MINVAEMRLYYYPPLGNSVEVLPIGIGQAGRETPRNWVTAVERAGRPHSWVPTANTRREYAKEGKTLPAMVPSGPDNPMGLWRDLHRQAVCHPRNECQLWYRAAGEPGLYSPAQRRHQIPVR